MEERVKLQIISDHRESGLSYRKLARKYGTSLTQIHRIVMSRGKKRQGDGGKVPLPDRQEAAMPEDIGELKEALRQARLKIELQDLMLDIASKEFGVDIRKKSGTKPSR